MKKQNIRFIAPLILLAAFFASCSLAGPKAGKYSGDWSLTDYAVPYAGTQQLHLYANGKIDPMDGSFPENVQADWEVTENKLNIQIYDPSISLTKRYLGTIIDYDSIFGVVMTTPTTDTGWFTAYQIEP